MLIGSHWLMVLLSSTVCLFWLMNPLSASGILLNFQANFYQFFPLILMNCFLNHTFKDFYIFCLTPPPYHYAILHFDNLPFFFKKNWYIILLQFFVSFCYTRSEPVICIHISSPTWISLPYPIHSCHHRALSWAPCAIQQIPISFLFYRW